MERIFLDYLGPAPGGVKIAVFHKDTSKDHVDGLKGFLDNQKIRLGELSTKERVEKADELEYFDGAFTTVFSPERWSFFELRQYIKTFLDTISAPEDGIRLQYDSKGRDKSLRFDSASYVELGRLIDQCEDYYFIGNHSIALFINGILQLLKENLQLYWAAATIKPHHPEGMLYFNHVPPARPKKEVQKLCRTAPSEQVRKFPVEFNNEHIADVFIYPSPFSPPKEAVTRFVEHVIMHIDDFIYGDIIFKRRTGELRNSLAELVKENTELKKELAIAKGESGTGFDAVSPADPAPTPLDLTSIKILVMGGTEIKSKVIHAEFDKAGFEKRNIDLRLEYDKLKSVDINDLKRIRGKYDGILLGPMPHKLRGDMDGGSLIGMMENNPKDYPPFVVLRDHAGGLKITKSGLKPSINEITEMLRRQNEYAEP